MCGERSYHMASNYSVTLDKLIDEFKLEPIYLPDDAKNIKIRCADLNRPGLQLAGFCEIFDKKRIQVMGQSEMTFLDSFSEEKQTETMDKYLALQPPALIITRNYDIPNSIRSAASMHKVALLRTNVPTSEFMSGLISTLNVKLAPRITRHGVLIEVYGEGILLLGESGVGKSETAIELVKRGHRLIADDAVEIRRVSAKTLVGSSPDNIRHFMELRGVGIINARKIFGVGSVNITQKIDMVIQLELWDKNKTYDRMGLDETYVEILGNQVTSKVIPVKPGRNLAVIIEVAAMNHREMKLGYNAAHELLDRLGMMDDSIISTTTDSEWEQI